MSSNKGKYIAGRDIVLHKISQLAAQGVFWAGLLLIGGVLGVVFFNPCPSQSQFIFYRLALASGLSLSIASISGVFLVSRKGTQIGAGFMVFVLSYFINPVGKVKNDGCSEKSYLRGMVYIGDKPLAGAEIQAPSLSESDYTNVAGAFELSYHPNTIRGPLSLFVNYRNIDTTIRLSTPLPDSLLIIRIKDTVPILSKEKAILIIESHTAHWHDLITSEHQAYMLKYQGRRVTHENISSSFRHYSEACDGEKRNSVSFENGFDRLETQKALKQAGIPIEPMTPYHGYYMENYETFLYEHDTRADSDQNKFRMHFAFLNRHPMSFRVDALTPVSKTKYQARVYFSENIRYVRVRVDFGMASKRQLAEKGKGPPGSFVSTLPKVIKQEGVKEQATFYNGMRPYENFIFRYEKGQWHITVPGTRINISLKQSKWNCTIN